MASYADLYDLTSNDGLRNKIRVAVIVAAQDLLDGTPTADDKDWAAEVFQNPASEGAKAFASVLAVNKDATQAQILAATDLSIQANVDAVVPNLVTAFAALLSRGQPGP